MRIGHHYYNWDWDWNRTDGLDLRLQATAETGYDGFEAWPEAMGVPAEELKRRCDARGLTCAAMTMWDGPLESVIDYAAAAGAGVVTAGFPAEETSRWVECAGERGVMLAKDNHISMKPGGVETREDLLAYVDARPGAYACVDTGHLLLCGSDPVQTILDLGERCKHVHLKDLDPAAVGSHVLDGELFWELGTGALDLAGVLDALKSIGFSGWLMVERDRRMDDYAASARRMRGALRELGC